jgi:hypothetical protein
MAVQATTEQRTGLDILLRRRCELRQPMIEDMTASHFAEKAQKDHIRQRQELRSLPRPLA